MYRAERPGDRPQVLALWKEVFGDEAAVASRLLDDFAGSGNVYVAEEDGRVIAQLLAVPCMVGGCIGAYLYALATEPNQRGRGVMGGLMAYAQKVTSAAGGTFFALIPASGSLFGYYERLGFETVFLRHAVQDSSGQPEGDFTRGKISEEMFSELRKRHLGCGMIAFDGPRTGLALEEQWESGCETFYCDDGYALCLKVGETLFVTELAVPGEELARRLVSSALTQTGCCRAKIALPASSLLYTVDASDADRTAEAQFKWWGPEPPATLYLRYALDDLPARIRKNGADRID